MSEVKVNKISPRSGTDVALGDSGDSFNVPSGAAIAVTGDLKSSTLKDSAGAVVISKSGTAVTLGASGDTVSVAGGATLEGAGLAWQSVVTASTLTTVAGRGYPINTTSNACTVTLPGSASAGDQVQIVDYAGTFATNNITLTSSLNIEGGTDDRLLTTNREGVTITYVDATQGWVATTGVNSGNRALDAGPYSVDFLVVAGGGGTSGTASGGYSGGGGAGGYRTSTQTVTTGVEIAVTVGDGGAGVDSSSTKAANGSDSSISGTGLTTITSAGGGAGGTDNGILKINGNDGGSGGGASGTGDSAQPGGSGNTPSTSPSQGNNGGAGNNTGPNYGGGGGGGASAVGGNGSGTAGGNGGAGSASSITGSSVTYAGGGGGMTLSGGTSGTGGTGGGGNAGNPGTAGTVNLGGGAGATAANGGKGVVILSMPDASYSGATTGSPTVATGVSGKTILTFTGSGSYTA